MPSANNKGASRQRNNLRRKEPQFSVPEDANPVFSADSNLFEYFKCCGKWLNEDRLLVRNRIRDQVEVPCWKGHIIGKGPILSEYPEDGAVRAVVAQSAFAVQAVSAAQVDLPDDPFPLNGLVSAPFNYPDKLMPRNTPEIHIPLDDLKVGVAYSRTCYPYKGLIFPGFRDRVVGSIPEVIVKEEGAKQIGQISALQLLVAPFSSIHEEETNLSRIVVTPHRTIRVFP